MSRSSTSILRATGFTRLSLLKNISLGKWFTNEARSCRSNRTIWQCQLINQELRHVVLHVTVGQHELHRLAFGERSAERDALLGITRGQVEAALGDTEAAAGLVKPSAGDPGLGRLHAGPGPKV
jgi:hypothetical protein